MILENIFASRPVASKRKLFFSNNSTFNLFSKEKWYMTLHINSALNVMQNSVMGLTEGGSILLPVKDS